MRECGGTGFRAGEGEYWGGWDHAERWHPHGLASLDWGRGGGSSIACAPRCVCTRRVNGSGFPQGLRSDESLPCSAPQVEYAYSDNSLDPGKCRPHRLQLGSDTPTSAL